MKRKRGTMDAKVLIQTDGNHTEIYVNGEKIDQTTMIDFHLHADTGKIETKYNRYATDADGNILYNGENQEKHNILFEDGIAIDMTE